MMNIPPSASCSGRILSRPCGTSQATRPFLLLRRQNRGTAANAETWLLMRCFASGSTGMGTQAARPNTQHVGSLHCRDKPPAARPQARMLSSSLLRHRHPFCRGTLASEYPRFSAIYRRCPTRGARSWGVAQAIAVHEPEDHEKPFERSRSPTELARPGMDGSEMIEATGGVDEVEVGEEGETASEKFVKHVRALTEEGDFDGVLRALDEEEKQSLLNAAAQDPTQQRDGGVDIEGYNACVWSMARGKRGDDAMELLNRMYAAGVKPEYRTFDRAISACCQAGKYHFADILRQRMRQAGISPGWSVFRAEFEHCGSVGNWKRTLELLEELKTDKIMLGVTPYNAALDAFAYSTAWREACALLREMQAAGWELHARSYRGAIMPAAAAGACYEALDLLGEMQESGVEPTSVSSGSYNAVILACANRGMWEEAGAVLEDMETAGFTPSMRSYGAVMTCYGKLGEWRPALQLMAQLKANGVVPNAYVYSCAISACGKAGYWHKAIEIFDDMRRDGVQPTTGLYNAMLSACGLIGGERELAIGYFRDMLEAGIEPDRKTYSAITGSLLTASAWQDTIQPLREILFASDKIDHKPTVIVARLLIRAYGRTDNWTAGVEILRELKRRGVKINLAIYNNVIRESSRPVDGRL